MRTLLLLLCTSACSAGVWTTPDLGDGYSAELASLNLHIDATAQRAGDDWTVWEQLGAHHLKGAKLTGEYEHYDHAGGALIEAFHLADDGAGPYATRAALHASMHELQLAQADLHAAQEGLILQDSTRASHARAQADLHWQRGEHAEAVRLTEWAQSVHSTPAGAARIAQQLAKTGDIEGAREAFETSTYLARGSSAHLRSWIHLQRGLLELSLDNPDSALEHYLVADAEMPGWWLVHEHIAEALVLTGRGGQALPIYEDVVQRTGSPELMGALAELRRARGHARSARELEAQAGEVFAARLKAYPLASAGHALDHYLQVGDTAAALRLAQANVAARPGAGAHLALGRAHLAHGDTAAAIEAVEHVLSGPWRTVELHQVAEEAYRAMGDKARAAEHGRLAEALAAR